MVTLNPEKKADKGKEKLVMNLSHDQVEKSLNECLTYAFIAREAEPEAESQIQGHIRPILEEFSEFLPKDLSGELPLMSDTQRAIDLVSRTTLPNLHHYKMNPVEHAELQR